MGDDGLAGARVLLPDVRLRSVDRLTGSDRSDVQRVRLSRPEREDDLVIVKSFTAAGDGWARESAALSVLPEDAPAPRVLHSGAEPPVLVLSDLGPGPNVADALLGDDPDAAERAVCGWAVALARLHRASAGLREAFRTALDERAGELPIAAEPVGAELADTVRAVDERCGTLGVATSTAAFDELRDLSRRLGGDGAAALTPADTCPDNNLRVGDHYALIDFEGAQWRHVAWDLAYVRVPWPTCWCSWRLPDAVADAALAAYRAEAAPAHRDVPDADVDAAAVGWAFASVHLFLGNALGDDRSLNPDRPTPTRRAMILHRLAVAARSSELPRAGEFAARLRAELVVRWGEVELAYAPAFS